MSEAKDLEAQKRDLLALLLAEEGIEEEEKPTIGRRPRPERIPCSFAQELLWLLHELSPTTTAYNVRWAMRITGALDEAALGRALDTILTRHEVLRTIFVSHGGVPAQKILTDVHLPIARIDARSMSKEAKDAEVQRVVRQNAERPWSFAKDTIHGTLVQLEETEFVLVLALHHIYCDGWSRGLFFKELAALYEYEKTGAPHGLPEPPIQYADFAIWQREWYESADYAKQLGYWKKQLAGAPSLLELPTDRPRPKVQTYRGSRESLRLPKDLTDKLRALSKKTETTLFMTLLAAFKTLLYRYTGQEDIVVGSPIANRNRSEVETIIGFFVNAVIMRSELSPELPFNELVKKVREVSLSAYDNQDIPYEKLVIELKPERDMSYTPLFQVMFILQNTPKESRELTGLSLSTVEMGHETAKFDLTLSCTEIGDEINAIVGYNVDLFDSSTIQRFLGNFRTLLESIVVDPSLPLGKIPILTPGERTLLLDRWNDTTRDYDATVCAHELIAREAAKTPDAIAVVADDGTITYGDLDARANQLAHHLRARGVGPDVLVGICAVKSVDLIVGLLGILKAGGAYVPMDPGYPRDRLEHVISDTRAKVLITQESLVANLPPDHGAELVVLDRDWSAIAAHPKTAPDSGVKPSNLAYSIFTSGSTGKSKGVMIEHGNLVNQYFAWEESYRLREIKSHLQMASMSFDVFSGDFVRALCSGARLVLCSRDRLLEPDKLYELMAREKVECAEFVPAVLRAVIDHLEAKNLRLDFMKILIAGSDVWQVKEYFTFKKYIAPTTRLMNSFGLTETTIDSTYFEAPDGELKLNPEGSVPIGRPFGNTRIYLLDKSMQPVPLGVHGEVFIGGKGVTRGYLNRPEMTAERFIDDPFTKGGKLYKTGDNARYHRDGNIEFLGRNDNQVKMRGYRIELGEIEANAIEHPSVGRAVVLVREDVPGNKRLVGYVVPKSGAVIDVPELKTFLKSKLPEYMVPTSFVTLDALPLQPNGKVDRRALPKPETAEDEGVFIGPRTPVEEMVAEIWGKLLKTQRIGVFDDFFDLGGHSLLATQIVSRVRESFSIEISLRTLFESPTVEGMALYIVTELAKDVDDEELFDPTAQNPEM